MSPLTKLFVVLSVILSLMITAASVVYVNKEDLNKQALDQTKSQLTAAKEEASRARDQMIAAQQQANQIQTEANEKSRAAGAELTNKQQQNADLNVQLAKASGQAAALQLDNSRLTEALNASQAIGGKNQEEVTRLRTANDTLVKQSSDLNGTVSDLSNKLEVTEKERRNLAEQLTQAQTDSQKMAQTLAQSGLSPRQQQTAAVRSGPPINAVVKDVRQITGNWYATISVGSADGVQRGMEFKAVDRASGNFLGTVVIDSVEPNESTGRLSGPAVAQIRPGVEVRTQL